MKRKKAALPEANEEVVAPELNEEAIMPDVNGESVEPEKVAKKTGRAFIIVSYLIALASLIATLFVPLYNGKMLFQLIWTAIDQTLQALHIATPKFAYGDFFISQTLSIYESALIVSIAVSTLLALIMVLPVTICKKPHSANLRCALAAEFIAFFVYTASAMQALLSLTGAWNNFAILIPFGVILIVMSAQSIKFKGSLGVAKFFVFLFALLTLFTLFDITAVIPVLEAPLKTFSGMVGAYSDNVTFIGSNPVGFNIAYELLNICLGKASFVDPAKTMAFINQILSMALVIIVLISVFTDAVSLIAGNKTDKKGRPIPHKVWFVFAAIRYSAIILLIAASVVLSFVDGSFGKVGLYMYFTLVLVLLTFITEIIRYCVAKAKAKAYDEQRKAEEEEAKRQEELIIEDEKLKAEQMNMFGEEPVDVTEAVEVTAEEAPAETDDRQLTIMEAQSVEAEVETAEVETAEVVEEATVEPVEEAVSEPTEEAVEPVEEAVSEPVEEAAVEPVEEFAAEPVEETVVMPVIEEAPAEEPVVTHYEAEETVDNSFNLFGEEEQTEETCGVDPFIDKLNDEERAQFYDVFINRNKGKFSSIPAYKLNENNADFFPSVFVHINRMRNLCCDSLLAKIYKEIDKD